jgi:hypothetical protein
MPLLHNVLSPSPRGRTQTAPGTNYLETVARKAEHWGTDLTPVVKGTAGDLVHAPADAIVVATGRGNGGRWSRVPWHSGKYVLLDLGYWGGDRMYVYFGHLEAVKVKAGDRVKAGDVVATMGGSGKTGANDFGVHLHLGVSQNTDRPTGPLYRGKGWIDPVRWFKLRGVDLNTSMPAAVAPPALKTASVTTKVVPVKIIPTTTPTESELTVSDVNTILDRLDKIEARIDSVDNRVKAHDGNDQIREKSTREVVRKLLTEDALVPWTDSVTGRVTIISIVKALANFSVLKYRERQAQIAAEEAAK